ncbi:MAG: arginine--tRNA ligase, partial [Patescibacteria group bacterium]|nr:arginine--tRNA ligase [Patescibacteria group bacterium]
MIKTKIIDLIKKTIGNDIEVEISIPGNEQFGHYSTNVALKLAKIRGENPMKIAESIKYEVLSTKPNFFEKIEIVPPGFVNFWVSEKVLQNEFENIYKSGGKWGKSKNKIKKNIVIDYCGINIAKPMSIGHLRSTIIGQALYNILKFSGHKAIGDSHLGDWGKQFGVLIAAYKEKQKDKKLKDISLEGLMELYVDYTARMKNDSKLEDIAKEEVKKLQSKNKENLKIWKKFRSITFKELKNIFNLLGVKFDHQLGESFYNPMLGDIVSEALRKKVAVK